ncbi:cache domain-containing protein (plasmid) [Aneurinibacillus sp. Ricciae_BoGa-3]|uniref:cache domain-containing protein n=1 Tax=Aneurinibacillus sp. Ricciae_BoGa-3 TaxID=3022697 RepID=UPI0023409CC6|nr:cache domain-containing protein [Aneurinibacillus sp. Ricciae_BoGa-3]WCK57301.1 cache domain-containing protein [Aneurinibacillus sp. Ricciae_BoGa-3]
MSIKRKLPIYIGGLVTASLVVAGLISYNTSSNSLINASKDGLHTNTERTSVIIRNLEKSEEQMASIMANNKRLQDLVVMKEQTNDQQFYTSNNVLLGAVNNFLKDSFATTTNHDHFFVLDNKGTDIADSLPENERKSFADRDYFSKALQGQTAIGKMVISKTNGKPVIVIAVPVKDSQGKIVGVLGNSILADFFTSNIQGIKVGTNGKVYIMDRDSTILGHSQDKTWVNKKSQRTELLDAMKTLPNDNNVNVSTIDAGTGSDKSLVTFANIPGTNWVVFLEDKYSDIQSPVRSLMVETLLGLLCLAL